MESIGLQFTVKVKPIEEVYPEGLLAKDVPLYLAKLKINAFENDFNKKDLIITSDTVVIHNNIVLGKPKNREDAFKMLKNLSNDSHDVVSGVAIFDGLSKEYHLMSDSTKVYFKELSDDEINFYIDNYAPFDKAGAYGIQEWIGMIGINKIEGCFYNVMGFPIKIVYDKLAEICVNE